MQEVQIDLNAVWGACEATVTEKEFATSVLVPRSLNLVVVGLCHAAHRAFNLWTRRQHPLALHVTYAIEIQVH